MRRVIGIVMLGAGVALALVSGLADVMGLGQDRGVGWKQLLGLLIAILLIVAGVVVSRMRRAP